MGNYNQGPRRTLPIKSVKGSRVQIGFKEGLNEPYKRGFTHTPIYRCVNPMNL